MDNSRCAHGLDRTEKKSRYISPSALGACGDGGWAQVDLLSRFSSLGGLRSALVTRLLRAISHRLSGLCEGVHDGLDERRNP